MYGQAGAVATGGGLVLAETGVRVGSMLLATIAVLMILFGIGVVVWNNRRRRGARP